ncbi:MAG: peptidoglycan recognition family protein [Propionibacteriaceae bacterium]|nr:peptidoglycan recognition family protein [Propionibacteriaceae bacterium]
MTFNDIKKRSLNRRTLLRAAPAVGLASVALVGGAAQARAADFADDFRQAVNYDPGRHLRSGQAAGLTGIVIHWWGEPSGASHESIAGYLAGPNSGASAHYVVSQHRTTQLVSLSDTAFHAGDYDINAQSVGIECRPEMDDETTTRLKQLIVSLRERYGPLWLGPHQQFSSTGCPGTYMQLIPALKVVAAGSLNNIPQPPGDPAPTPPPSDPGALDVDGYWGAATTTQLQKALGTPVDGVISKQAAVWKARNPGLVSGWDWVPEAAATGSTVMRALQKKVGADADGLIGPNTIKAIQKYYGQPQDGTFAEGSATIKALQQALNDGKV